MYVDSEIRQAIEFESDVEHPVLSVYLNVDPHRRSAEKYKLALRSLSEQSQGGRPRRRQAHAQLHRDGLQLARPRPRHVQLRRQGLLVGQELHGPRRPTLSLRTSAPTSDSWPLSSTPTNATASSMWTRRAHGSTSSTWASSRPWKVISVRRSSSIRPVDGLQPATSAMSRAWPATTCRTPPRSPRLSIAGRTRSTSSWPARSETSLASRTCSVNRLRSMVAGHISADANASPSTVSEKADRTHSQGIR